MVAIDGQGARVAPRPGVAGAQTRRDAAPSLT
jgi:hypothetical protein